MGAARKIQARLPSLPKITYKGAAVGANSITTAVKTVATQVAKPVEKVAAATVAVVASTFTGMPITPKMVDQAATQIKVNTYAKPATATPSPLAIAKEVAAVGSVAELYRMVLHRGATPSEIAAWNAKFGATITADEVEQFKIAAQAELKAIAAGAQPAALATPAAQQTKSRWILGGITCGLVLLWIATRKKKAA